MLTIERIFAAPDLSGASLRSPQISPDGHYVAYLRGSDQNKDRLDLWAYDIRAKKHTLLVDSSQLVPQERAIIRRGGGAAGAAAHLLALRDHRVSVFAGFAVDSRAAGRGHVCLSTCAREGPLGASLQTESFETDARFSPAGRYVSFVRDQNLVIYDLTTGKERADDARRRAGS